MFFGIYYVNGLQKFDYYVIISNATVNIPYRKFSLRQKKGVYMKDRSKDELILSNIKLVHYCLQTKLSIRPGTPEYEELFSVGQLGLVKAAKRFDETKGFTFSTYAVSMITGEIQMYLRKNQSSIKLSLNRGLISKTHRGTYKTK